jgi:ATP-dependent exoDNAse (exonuclease V) alpha subunit
LETDKEDILFKFIADVSSNAVKKHKNTNYSHFPMTQYFKIGTNVILRKNIWKKAGLFNGSKGQIKDIVMNDDGTLKAILCEFETFTGTGYNGSNLVPIEPMIIENKKNKKHTRRVAPIE